MDEKSQKETMSVIRKIFKTVMKAIPKEHSIKPLEKGEEVEGIFAMFFTTKGVRGMCAGAMSHEEVLQYLSEVYLARQNSLASGECQVSKESVNAIRRNESRIMRDCYGG